MKYNGIRRAKFIDRPNRFIANVELDGKREKVHVKNTGRCKEIFVEGTTVILEEGINSNRKTRYSIIGCLLYTSKQKVLLVRALLHSPKILFLDEPTSGLDPASADTIHRILRELNDQGITILLTSHNMEEVDKLCNRVAFLNQGEIVEMGSPEALKLDHSNRRIKVLKMCIRDRGYSV